MTRISRTVSAAVLSAALLVAVSPAAQARTPERHQAPRPAETWLDMAFAWLTDFVVSPIQQGQTHKSPTTKIYTYPSIGTSGSGGFGGATTMCASTIDPQGSCQPTGS